MKYGKSDKRVCYDAGKARERNEIGEKIKELRRSEKMSLKEFTEKLEQRGVITSVSAVSKWELGQTLPNAYQLLAVFDCFGIADPSAFFAGTNLLNEEGLRKAADYREDLIASGRYSTDISLLQPDIVYIRMPVSLVPASAGTGDILDEEMFEYRTFPADEVPDGADFAVRVDGDSMSPEYEDGQIVWVRRAASLLPGEEGLFILNGNGYIKQYREREPADAAAYTDSHGSLHPQPVLVSYNDAYAPIVVGVNDSFRICGKILSR